MKDITWLETLRMRRAAMGDQYGRYLTRDILRFSRNMSSFFAFVVLLSCMGGRFEQLSWVEFVRRMSIGFVAAAMIGAALRIMQEVVVPRSITIAAGTLTLDFGLSCRSLRTCSRCEMRMTMVNDDLIRLEIPLGQDGASTIVVGANSATAELITAARAKSHISRSPQGNSQA